MRRRIAFLGLCAALAGCQEYRFNPVGRCTIQPGQRRIQLEAFSTADILFVVDDSGSMEPVQDNLANNFSAFIQALAATQQDRRSRGLEALDFHIAVTTSSIFVHQPGLCQGSPLACNIIGQCVPPQTTSCIPASYISATSTCSTSAQSCGGIVDRFYNVGNNCSAGVAVNGADYPGGAFVAASGNPKVLHFTKGLDWANWSTDAVIGALMAQFSQNIKVGSCGSGQEQHLEAGRLAIQKALAGTQTAAAGEWPHASSKLVAVFVANEDDCSTPKDPARALVMQSFNLGADSCNSDQQLPAAQQKLIPVDDYRAFFAGLGRPLAAAFIRPGDAGCDINCGSSPTPSCCSTQQGCGGYSPGNRLRGAVSAFRSVTPQVVDDSVCSSRFSTTLERIAELVKPLEGLKLPSQPAAGVVTRLRIVDSDNTTVKLCTGPATSQEWWFVTESGGACSDVPTGSSGADPTPCIAIRRGGGCEASPGQTYVAEYLGRVPAEGCTVGAGGAAQCATALGGAAADWTCDGAAGQQGTCLCAP